MSQNTVLLEYIWLDCRNDFRSKTKVMKIEQTSDIMCGELPVWNYDGSSTGQAIGTDSEVFLKPAKVFRDPFRRKSNAFLVWCDMINKDKKPLENSNRQFALDIFQKYSNEEPWFGLEQEYFIVNPKTNLPLSFEQNSNPEPQGKYYCSVGSDRALCREIPEEHLEHCLYAGIEICGINGEVAPAQWEYQIGPSVGVDAGDHLWVSRYILNRIAESYGYNISYHPKPLGVDSDWNGSGCHTNFSTKNMREPNGIEHIYDAIKKLSKQHMHHMKYYGENNELRMSGLHETSSYNKFTYGRANRGASVRIPNSVLENSCGYFEDRRPAANCDPYLVTGLIMNTYMTTELDDEYNSKIKTLLELGYII